MIPIIYFVLLILGLFVNLGLFLYNISPSQRQRHATYSPARRILAITTIIVDLLALLVIMFLLTIMAEQNNNYRHEQQQPPISDNLV